MKNLLLSLLLLLSSSRLLQATEVVQGFKSPAFTGVGYSSHELTLQTLTFNRKQTAKDKAAAAESAAKAAAANTPVNQFVVNLQARIYSQIAAQVTNKLFSTGATFGQFDLPDGAFVSWIVANGVATLSIFDSATNTTTTLKIPVSTLILSGGSGG